MHDFFLCDVFGCEREVSDLTSDKSSSAVASERITEPTAGAKSIFIGVQLMSLELLTKDLLLWYLPDVRPFLPLSTPKHLLLACGCLDSHEADKSLFTGRYRRGRGSHYPQLPVEK